MLLYFIQVNRFNGPSITMHIKSSIHLYNSFVMRVCKLNIVYLAPIQIRIFRIAEILLKNVSQNYIPT